MKIKTKLIISFCIIIFVPVLLAFLVMISVFSFQLRAIERNYGIDTVNASTLTNSMQLLNRYTESNFEELQAVAESSPSDLEDESCLESYNSSLLEKSSYLVVRKDGEVIYNGSTDNDSVIEMLMDFGSTDADSSVGRYVDSEEEVLIKQLDFYYTDGSEGSLFLITDTKLMLPEIRRIIRMVLVTVILILLLTATVLIIWIYRSIYFPIKELRTAAENIKEGNLDDPTGVSGDDEIGQLGVTFEQMRQRLKDNAEEKLQNERENRVLISNIAHDLRTPITSVKGYAEGIMDGVANTPEKLDQYVRTIYNKACEMNTLINELILYSKIDTNRIPYNFAKINVADYFRDCVEELGLDLEVRGISLSYYNYAAEDTVIIADPEQLKRVLNNIVGNSIKYMNKPSGYLGIRIKDVGDFVQVEVEDNGRGIAQKDLPYIFDRFYRTDESRNSATGGSGIGLSIVRKIVEDHGGRIWATSKENVGTIMYFVIRKYQENVQEVQNEQNTNSGR